MTQNEFRLPELHFDTSNPDPRCACVLVLDTSTSMAGEKINQLNEGLQAFQTELRSDEIAQSRVEVAVVTFGPVQIAVPFTSASEFRAPELVTTGDTPLGAALHQALDMVHERKALYRSVGIPYYRPWIMLVTDGTPSDGTQQWKSAAQRIRAEEVKKGVAFFGVGVAGADMHVLSLLSHRQPIGLKGYSFREMFVWLSGSLQHVSQSQPNDAVTLKPTSDWGTL